MASDLLAGDVEAILDATFVGADETLLVVDPSKETLVSLIEAATARDDFPMVSVLAAEQVLKSVGDAFPAASRAAALIAADELTLRLLPAAAENALFASASRVVALVDAGDQIGALATTDDEFVTAVFNSQQAAFADATEYDLRTPPIGRVRETLATAIGETVRDDFDAVFDAVTRDGDSALDAVTVSLLVAARNDVLLYDISKWGEDVGIASKATFSRTKSRLEDAGVIDTEKVPIDVGRPRLRLTLGDERLIGVDTDEFAAVATDLTD